jgi:glycosyltransferase involved in cell wall biosynthesis
MGPSTMPTTSGIQEQVTREVLSNEAVNLLYVCDFCPSNDSGGAILMKRMLQSYAPDHVIVFTNSEAFCQSQPPDRLSCPHVVFPKFGVSKRLWVGRLKHLLNWAVLACVTVAATMTILRRQAAVLVTVFHDRYFLAAAAAGWLTRKPYVVVVHDDFVSREESATWFSRRIVKPLSGMVLRHAAHVYAISPGMRRLLQVEFGAESEVQWPATERHPRRAQFAAAAGKETVILFAGGIGYAVEDSLRLLIEIITSSRLKRDGISVKLHLYSRLSDDQRGAFGNHPDVVVKNWVMQSEMPGVLAGADILFLPYSFLESSRHAVETAFPSKTADYLAAGKPVLVFGPPYSTVVDYALEEGFAEVVTECSADALIRAIERVLLAPGHGAALRAKALEVFFRNHDIDRQRAQFRLLLQSLTRST